MRLTRRDRYKLHNRLVYTIWVNSFHLFKLCKNTFSYYFLTLLIKNRKKLIDIKHVVDGIYFTSLTCRFGGKDCFNFSAFSLSYTTNVYTNREQRILNLVFSWRLVVAGFLFILTARASFLRAVKRNSFTSLISLGILKYTTNLYSFEC